MLLALSYSGLADDVCGRCRNFGHGGVIDGWMHQKGDTIFTKLLCDGKGGAGRLLWPLKALSR